MCAFPKRRELYCGLFDDCTLFVFSPFLYFVVRVRCCRKKFTFAISSADEFLVSLLDKTDVGHNTCTLLHFTSQYRHPSKETGDFDVVLFQIYYVYVYQ